MQFSVKLKRKKNILIIDDSNTNLLLLDWVLEQEGYNAHKALSVAEAKKLIKKRKPDLILLDLSMPEVSGFDFLKMKPDLDLKDIPIIVVSAHNNIESIELSHELGAAEFIAKPFKVEDIVNIAKKYLR
jgi:DNA-binding NtrC family response regulator